jgi:hypothetical protein
VDELNSLCPIQNEGASAKNIAYIIENFIEFKGKKEDFVKTFDYLPHMDEVDKMLENLNIRRKKGKNRDGVEELELV